MPEGRPVILSQSMVSRCLADSEFLAQVPEFSTLKAKLKVMRIERTRRGCSGCRKVRVQQNLFKDFQLITLSLGRAGLDRMKRYLGVESLMMNTLDTKTNKVRVRVV